MSMENGQPLLLCDAGTLTTERTAATTALAVDLLAAPNASRLAIIGSGKVALAHLRYALSLRLWSEIRVFSPSLQGNTSKQENFTELSGLVRFPENVEDATAHCDVIMLCTSSGSPVLNPDSLTHPALITSISTNAPRAHEIPPASLRDMQVYCDYKKTTPSSAGEMQLAASDHGWSHDSIVGDLPALVTAGCPKPDFGKHRYFRSIGLGMEDIAVAAALYNLAAAAN
jgi:L-arginine dehydrogenase